MTDEREQQETTPRTADDDGRDGGINDLLTRSDVEAPRAPFGSSPEPKE